MTRAYINMYKGFLKYEEIAVDYFSDSDAECRILTHFMVGDVKEKVVKAFKTDYKNPYRQSYIWLKGELLEIAGMIGSMNSYEGLIKKQKIVQKKKEEDQSELGNLYSNKTSIKNFFQSKQVKEN